MALRDPRLLLVACLACGGGERRAADRVVFDPARVRVGDSVAGLRVDALDVRQASDGEWVGTVRFAGAVAIGGHTMAHPDADVAAPCFEADSTSAARLPRWTGDTRRSWFCFTNVDSAAAWLGPMVLARAAVITIDSFTIHHAHSDVVNSARLLRVDGGVREGTR
jgi:hypothetical protein